MGRVRDLKKATEAYWGGKSSRDDLLAEGKRLRAEHWGLIKKAGVDSIPSNDFAFYGESPSSPLKPIDTKNIF
jgi:5-methyltetrahydropteroyltriglutamate--homocysteine methyltransferase